MHIVLGSVTRYEWEIFVFAPLGNKSVYLSCIKFNYNVFCSFSKATDSFCTR